MEQEQVKPNKTRAEPEDKRQFIQLVRIMQTDIPGNKKILVGLTLIKGISWSFSNAICRKLKMNIDKKIGELSKEEIQEITKFMQNPELPHFLLNRRKDFETGKDSHLTGADLELKNEFDIRRLKKIRSFRGLRHATGQPTRGQRTRSHFRARGKKKTIGVKKSKTKT
mgnify:CR=1 FL=1